jgi:hypothetical protein
MHTCTYTHTHTHILSLLPLTSDRLTLEPQAREWWDAHVCTLCFTHARTPTHTHTHTRAQISLSYPLKTLPRRPLSNFERPIAPFRHPFTGRDLMPSDCFSSRDLGYQVGAGGHCPVGMRGWLKHPSNQMAVLALLPLPVSSDCFRSRDLGYQVGAGGHCPVGMRGWLKHPSNQMAVLALLPLPVSSDCFRSRDLGYQVPGTAEGHPR